MFFKKGKKCICVIDQNRKKNWETYVNRDKTIHTFREEQENRNKETFRIFTPPSHNFFWDGREGDTYIAGGMVKTIIIRDKLKKNYAL